MNKQTAILAKNLVKKFGESTAVSNVSFTVLTGDIFALIGENGAGKTTIIKMMTSLYTPDSGSISLFSHDIEKDPEQAKKTFGYVSDNPTVYGHLTGREFFYFAGRLRGMSEELIKKRVEELLHLFLLEHIDSPMSDYSRGNRQKIAFISSLLDNPQIIIIDEPIVGLDPDSIEIFGKTLQKFVKEGGTVFFSTHILSFAEKYATKVGVIHKGVLKKEIEINKTTNLNELYHNSV